MGISALSAACWPLLRQHVRNRNGSVERVLVPPPVSASVPENENSCPVPASAARAYKQGIRDLYALLWM
jgi:hypothetical protein